VNGARPQAVFIKDVNLADRSEVETNSTIIKTWSVKNAGTQQWPEGTQLIVVRGDYELASQEEFPVPLAKAGEIVEVSAVLNVPEKHGRYSVYFRLADADRNVFGPRIWCDIIAVQPEPKPVADQQTQTPAAPPAPSTGQHEEMSAEQVDEEALIAEAVNSTTLPSVNTDTAQPQEISYPSLSENAVPSEDMAGVSSSTRSSSTASSSGSQKWDVVIEDDLNSEDEKYDTESQEKKPLIDKTQRAASAQEKVTSTTANSTSSSASQHAPSPSPSTASNVSSTSTSAQQYASELATLNELGFTNQALNLFLLKQQQGNVKKVVEWLVERLQ